MKSKVFKILKWILDYLPEVIAMVALCIAIPVSAANAFSRYAFKYTFLGYDEVIRIAFAWVVFPGAAAAYWRHMHFGVDLIVNLCPPKIQEIIGLLTQIFMTFLVAVLCFLSFKLMREVGAKYFPVTFISYGYYDAAMVVGFGFMAIYSAIFTVQKAKALFSKKVEISSTEGGNEE